MKPFFKYFLFVFVLALFIVFVFFLVQCVSQRQYDWNKNKKDIIAENCSELQWQQHVYLGLPRDDDPSDDLIIKRQQYVVSFNPDKLVANWVAWQINDTWYGDVSRYGGNFIKDPLLPHEYNFVSHGDYTNCGYDRGHLVRSKERTKTKEDNVSTFYLTNTYPQTPELNRGPWLKLEMYCEQLCTEKNKELYVYAGGIFVSNNTLCNRNKVCIPDTCYKIICVLDKNQSIENINKETDIIAVAMPNTNGIRSHSWEQYITTVRKIENSTSYDFFSNIPPKVQEQIETKEYTK